MKHILYSLLLVSLFLFLSFDLPKSGIKKMDKAINNLFENQIIKKEEIILSATEKANLSFKIDNNQLYRLTTSKLVGYVLIDRKPSHSAEFDYMVVFDNQLKILTVQLLVYREERGIEIGSMRWLKQFVGKSNSSEMEFGKDIQNISGSTISARSMTKGVNDLTSLIQELDKHKLLNK